MLILKVFAYLKQLTFGSAYGEGGSDGVSENQMTKNYFEVTTPQT